MPDAFTPHRETIERMVASWLSNPHAIHERPPYVEHSFHDDDRYWVVGSTKVSVLHGWHGSHDQAEALATHFNKVADAIARGEPFRDQQK